MAIPDFSLLLASTIVPFVLKLVGPLPSGLLAAG